MDWQAKTIHFYSRRLRSFGSRSGRTLTELMISLGLSVGVVAIVGVAISAGSDWRKIERAKSELIEQSLTTLSRMKADFNAAAKVTGASAAAYPGVFRINSDGTTANPRANPTDNDSVALYTSLFHQFRVPTYAGTVYDPAKYSGLGRIILNHYGAAPNTGDTNNPESIDLMYNITRFVKRSLKTTPFISIQNSEANNILQVNLLGTNCLDSPYGSGIYTSGGVGVSCNDITFPAPTLYTYKHEEYGNLISSVGAIERVEWIFSNNQLIRQVRNGLPPTAPTKIEPMGAKVDLFQVDYTFRPDPRPIAGLAVPKPNQKLSHIRDPNYYGGGCVEDDDKTCCTGAEPCVDWQDLDRVWVRMRFMSDLSVKKIPEAAAKLGFQIINGRLAYEVNEALTLENYTEKLTGEDTVGVDQNCSENNPANRCKPECAYVFNDPTPCKLGGLCNPKWVGYGQYYNTEGKPISDYCRCGTDVNDNSFIPPESWAGLNRIPAYQMGNDTSNMRVNSCVYHFGCSTAGMGYAFDRKHKLCGMLVNCLANPNGKYAKPDPAKGNTMYTFDLNSPAWQDLKTRVTAATKPDNWSEDMTCNYPSYCTAGMQQLFGITTKRFEEFCACQPGIFQYAHFDKLCHSTINSSPTGITCDNTWDGTTLFSGKKVFKTKEGISSSDPQWTSYEKSFVRKEDALLCQCLEDMRGPGGNFNSDRGVLAWPFFVAAQPGDPFYDATDHMKGTLRSREATAYYTNGTDADLNGSADIQTVSGRCDSVVLNYYHPGAGGAAADPRYALSYHNNGSVIDPTIDWKWSNATGRGAGGSHDAPVNNALHYAVIRPPYKPKAVWTADEKVSVEVDPKTGRTYADLFNDATFNPPDMSSYCNPRIGVYYSSGWMDYYFKSTRQTITYGDANTANGLPLPCGGVPNSIQVAR